VSRQSPAGNSFPLPEETQEIVRAALAEDVGTGDITTEATVPVELSCDAIVVAKQKCVVCGLPVVRMLFQMVDPQVSIEALVSEGGKAKAHTEILRLRGKARSILTAERVALNFLQRLSGIATATRRLVEMVEGTRAQVLDTRKTTPLLRPLQKYAVRVGGGANHRMGLYDGVLIKGNHAKIVGSVAKAVRLAREKLGPEAKIEAEVESADKSAAVVRAGADTVLLDNMTPLEVRKAVSAVAGRARVEVSGGITEENIRAYADCGVDYISVGALTHSAPSIDMSLHVLGTSPSQ
jgi:nicotinate-nucleotide pyrophosphorylase (carboxylating)